MEDYEKMCTKLERRIFKMECKVEAINDELYHLELIRLERDGKLNKKRYYRKVHLEKVLLHYYDEMEDMRQELKRLKKISNIEKND